MENEITKLQWAKMFIDHLANGVDPVTNSDVDTNTLHNEQIISCFRYISDIMSAVIYESETKSRKYKDFYAIVLDRGGAIKGNLMDLLFVSEKSVDIGRENVKYTIVRWGWNA